MCPETVGTVRQSWMFGDIKLPPKFSNIHNILHIHFSEHLKDQEHDNDQLMIQLDNKDKSWKLQKHKQ